MAIDVGRVIQAAIEAATQEPSPNGEAKMAKPRLSGGRAVLLGAGLVTIGRLAAPKGREILGSVQQMLEESEPDREDEEQETDQDYDDEPEGGADGDFDEDEDEDEEPEGEADEDFDEDDDDEAEDERPRQPRRTRSRARTRP